MAGTARGWVLPIVLPVVLLAAYSGWASVTFQGDEGKGQLWLCPDCKWVEHKAKGTPAPLCDGPDEKPHPRAVTTLLEGKGHSKSVGPRRFKRA